MTKGKIVLVPFPFDDQTAGKVRPADGGMVIRTPLELMGISEV
jgi:hypothetical protein